MSVGHVLQHAQLAAFLGLVVLIAPARTQAQSNFDDHWRGDGATTAAADTRSAQAAPQQPGARQSKQQQQSAQPQEATKQPPNSLVTLEQALYLIRSTLLTLNDANRSGNYSVLRDLAAQGFQSKNTAADLAQIFSDLRHRHVDLFAVAVIAPQLQAAPALDDKGMLRLTGYFPTQPLRISFDLLFQNVENQWRLFGISVQTPEVAPQANLPPAQAR